MPEKAGICLRVPGLGADHPASRPEFRLRVPPRASGANSANNRVEPISEPTSPGNRVEPISGVLIRRRHGRISVLSHPGKTSSSEVSRRQPRADPIRDASDLVAISRHPVAAPSRGTIAVVSACRCLMLLLLSGQEAELSGPLEQTEVAASPRSTENTFRRDGCESHGTYRPRAFHPSPREILRLWRRRDYLKDMAPRPRHRRKLSGFLW